MHDVVEGWGSLQALSHGLRSLLVRSTWNHQAQLGLHSYWIEPFVFVFSGSFRHLLLSVLIETGHHAELLH